MRTLNLFLLFFFLFALNSYSLPKCTGRDSSVWDLCIGEYAGYKGEYKGEYKEEKPHGKGTMTYYNGDEYIGQWKDGKYHGKGTWTSPDGKKYVGEHKDGIEHGKGTYTWANGDRYVQRYKNGVLMSEVLIPTRKKTTH